MADPTVIVVPCYNEQARFDPERFAAFARAREHVQLVLVDDGSDDATPDLLDELAERLDPRAEVLRLPANRGKAEAVRRGMAAAFARAPARVAYWDADLSTPLEELDRFAAVLDRHPEVVAVLGSRVKLMGRDVERKALRHYPGRVFATFASWTLGLAVYDTQCGAKLFRNTPEVRGLFEAPFLAGWSFDVELLARLVAARRREGGPPVESALYELPLRRWREAGTSKVSSWDFPRALRDLVRIRRRYLSRRAAARGR